MNGSYYDSIGRTYNATRRRVRRDELELGYYVVVSEK